VHPRNLIDCACGCGSQIIDRDDHGRLRTYRDGHQGHAIKGVPRPEVSARMKGKPQGFREPNPVARTSHWRAVQLKKHITACEWAYLGECTTVLDVAHVDQDEMNNAPENLLKLCRRHHRLLDNGNIDATNPVMPMHHVLRTDGKRIYATNNNSHVG
jgi:hypothetical protein